MQHNKSVFGIDRLVLTNVCGIDTSQIKPMRNKVTIQNGKKRMDLHPKREYLNIRSKWSPDGDVYQRGCDICSMCSSQILSSDWRSIADASTCYSSETTCDTSNAEHVSSESSHCEFSCSGCSTYSYSYFTQSSLCSSNTSLDDYSSLYRDHSTSDDTYRYVEDLRRMYSMVTDSSYRFDCDCSESDCHHVLLGPEFSDLVSLVEQKNKQIDPIDAFRNIQKWLLSLSDGKNGDRNGENNKKKKREDYRLLNIDTYSVIRYVIIYVILYFLGLL